MRTHTHLAVMLLAAPICTATAQDRISLLEPGQRVRVTVPSLGLNQHEESFSGVQGDTLVLASMRCPITDVERLDVHAGRRSRAVTGALVGAVAGLLAGVPLGMAEQSRYDCDPNNGFAPCIPPMPTIPVMLAALGAGVGAVTGAFIKTDRWEEVPLEQVRVSVAPQRGGVVIGISMAF